MASKTAKKLHKDPSVDHKKRNPYDPSQEKIRVIQHNLVFLSGLPTGLADQHLLSNDQYFGRYGKIKKVIINNAKKSPACQAYVTYDNEVEASTAIIALDGLTMESRPLKASYGTTKYCTHFLKNYQCLNQECFYLHNFEKENEVQNKIDPRSSFIDKNDEALNMVCRNLERIVQKIIERGEDSDETDEGFPTMMQMIDFLIDSKLVESTEVQELIKKYKSLLKQNSSHQSKQSKSNSFSTIASPNKSDYIQKKDKIEIEIENREEIKQVQTQMGHKKQVKLQNNSQNRLQKIPKRKMEDVEKIVQKLIIKQIWDNRKGLNNKSKLNFAQNDSCSNQKQLRTIKSIIQKHLIASN